MIAYVEYYGLEHLAYVLSGWEELHCLFVDGMILIKLRKSKAYS